jgi:A nuclease family of the HNH/ENDO VII superfamily with conserved AHH
MARDFARGEQIKRPPSILGQQNDTTQQLQASQDQSQNLGPAWQNRGPAWRAWEGDTPPPIPEHLKSNAWRLRLPESLSTGASEQSLSSENNNTAQSIAAAPQQQQSGQGQQPQKVAQASTQSEQSERSWLNSGIAAKGGLETIPFDGRIVRTSKEGKQVIIPVKYGQKFQMQPGDQLQYPMATDSGKQKTANSLSQAAQAQINVFKYHIRWNALHWMDKNRTRLNQSQQRYKNLDPSNPNWASLRQRSAQVRDLNARSRQSVKQLLDTYRKVTGDRTASPFPLLVNVTDPNQRRQFILNFYQKQAGAKAWKTIAPQMIEQADQLHTVESLRMAIYAAEPALAVLTPGEVKELQANTPENNRKLQQKMNSGFDSVRDSIGKLEQALRTDKDGSIALQLDLVVSDSLANIKDPQRRQYVINWVNEQRQAQQSKQLLNVLGPIGLTVVSALLPQSWPVWIGRGLAVGAGAWGTGSAVEEMNRSGIGLDAAQAGDLFGMSLTEKNPNQARSDYLLSFVGVGLALADVGLTMRMLKGVNLQGLSSSQLQGLSAALKGKTLPQARKALAQLKELPQQVRDRLGRLLERKANGQLALEGVPNGLDDAARTNQPMQTGGSGGSTTRTPTRTPNPNVTTDLARQWSSAKNWNEVEPIIGKQAGANLPDGYHYRTRKDGRSEIVRKTKNDKEMVPLQVAEDGTFRIATTFSNRISNARRMGLNFEKAYGKLKDGYWIHHLIPDAVVRNNPLAKFARSIGYDLDHSSNLLGLADKETWAKIRTNQLTGASGNGYSNKVGHWSSHENYSRQVKGYLERELQRLKSKFGNDLEKAFEDPTKAKPQLKQEVEQTMKDAENYFRDLINKGKAPSTPEGRISWNNEQMPPTA